MYMKKLTSLKRLYPFATSIFYQMIVMFIALLYIPSNTSFASTLKTTEGPYGDIVRLSASCGQYSDETVVRFKEGATSDFDSQFDAYKLMNGGLSPSLFSSSANTDYSINSLPSNLPEQTIQLTLITAFAGQYTFTADFSECAGEQTIWLEDRLLGTRQNLREKNVYSIALDQGSTAERFFIQYRNQDIETVTGNTTPSANPGIEVSANLQTVSVLCTSTAQKATIMVIDSLGKNVYELDDVEISSGKLEFTLPESTGIHIIRVITRNAKASRQVYLTK
jgi:hypothetical protein